jgi:hypothetical protein
VWGTAMQKAAKSTVGVSAWEIARGAVSRRPPISLATTVARTEGYTYDGGSLGFVHRPRAGFCRPVPNPQVTISQLFPPLSRQWSGRERLAVAPSSHGAAAVEPVPAAHASYAPYCRTATTAAERRRMVGVEKWSLC